MRILIRSAAFVALLVLVASAGSAGERRFEKKFSVSPGGLLRLETDIGSVRVTAGAGNEVSILADLRGRERDVDEFQVTAEQTGNEVSVRGVSTRRHRSYSNFEVHYTITVPREYNLQLRTSGGNVDIAGVKGKVEGHTSGGNMEVRDVAGPTRIETSGGNLVVEKVDGDLLGKTSGGNIRISGIKGSVDVRTSGGHVSVQDVEGKVQAETSGGNVTVMVRGPYKGLRAETSGGNIKIFVPKDIAATIDASTSGGDVICDLPVTVSGRISEDRVRGTVNGGGETLYAHTSGGDVKIMVRSE